MYNKQLVEINSSIQINDKIKFYILFYKKQCDNKRNSKILYQKFYYSFAFISIYSHFFIFIYSIISETLNKDAILTVNLSVVRRRFVV